MVTRPVMSVLPLKTDIRQREWHVRYVPLADIRRGFDGRANSRSAVPLVSEQSLDGPPYVFLGGLGLCRGRGIRRYVGSVVIAGGRGESDGIATHDRSDLAVERIDVAEA